MLLHEQGCFRPDKTWTYIHLLAWQLIKGFQLRDCALLREQETGRYRFKNPRLPCIKYCIVLNIYVFVTFVKESVPNWVNIDSSRQIAWRPENQKYTSGCWHSLERDCQQLLMSVWKIGKYLIWTFIKFSWNCQHSHVNVFIHPILGHITHSTWLCSKMLHDQSPYNKTVR